MHELLDEVVHTRAAPGSDAWVGLAGFTDRGAEIALKLHAEVIGIPAPNIDSGRKAKGYVVFYGRLAAERMASEKRRVRALPRNLTLIESIRALDHLQLALADAIGLMRSAKGITTAQIPELENAFENSDSCRELDAVRLE